MQAGVTAWFRFAEKAEQEAADSGKE